MPRIAAFSAVTLPPGSTPPLPGFAPCDILISNAFTTCASSFARSGEKLPSLSRIPYFAVPICMMMSQPPSR
jgi:hypothetical protein